MEKNIVTKLKIDEINKCSVFNEGNIDISVKNMDDSKDTMSKFIKDEAAITTTKLTESEDIEHKNSTQKEKDDQISIQIKDGKLSNPDGPIQVLDSLFKTTSGDISEITEEHIIEDKSQEGN